jgi:cell division protein FtsL
MDKFIELVLQKISEQGISVVFLAFALYYMHTKLTKLEQKITECETDRLRLWEKIAQLHD